MAIVRINPRLEAEVTGSRYNRGPMSHVLADVGEEIVEAAQDLARADFYDTGAYTRGIEFDLGVDRHGAPVGRVVGTDWKSHWAEWPPRRQRRRRGRILSRAAEQVGLDVLTGELTGALL